MRVCFLLNTNCFFLLALYVSNNLFLHASHSCVYRSQILPALTAPVLDDYKATRAEVREPDVLSLFASVVETLGRDSAEIIPKLVSPSFVILDDIV